MHFYLIIILYIIIYNYIWLCAMLQGQGESGSGFVPRPDDHPLHRATVLAAEGLHSDGTECRMVVLARAGRGRVAAVGGGHHTDRPLPLLQINQTTQSVHKKPIQNRVASPVRGTCLRVAYAHAGLGAWEPSHAPPGPQPRSERDAAHCHCRQLCHCHARPPAATRARAEPTPSYRPRSSGLR